MIKIEHEIIVGWYPQLDIKNYKCLKITSIVLIFVTILLVQFNNLQPTTSMENNL